MSEPHPPRLGVLVSGSGTNLQALLDADLGAPVALVISNRADAFALERARSAGVKSLVIDHKRHAGREAFDAALVAALREHQISHVVLAGFMRILTRVLLDAFPQRVLNIHPSLLPLFPGLDAQQQTLEAGALIAGCSVHLVDGGVDSGPVLAQAVVPVLPGDDVAALRERILVEEHALLPWVVRAWVTRGLVATARGPALPSDLEVPTRERALWAARRVEG